MLWSLVCISCHCVLHEKYRVALVVAFLFLFCFGLVVGGFCCCCCSAFTCEKGFALSEQNTKRPFRYFFYYSYSQIPTFDSYF